MSAPLAAASSTSLRVSAAEAARGFSARTCLCASSASVIRAACDEVGVQTCTTSTEPSTSPRDAADLAPWCRARATARAGSESTTAATHALARRTACACQRPMRPAPTIAARNRFNEEPRTYRPAAHRRPAWSTGEASVPCLMRARAGCRVRAAPKQGRRLWPTRHLLSTRATCRPHR